ncbi:T9SS type A sorting domain-containing protein [Dyadobacter tibetensis]|uniref:T9SS type A sorting domain-containing protein n=1 Tax=Dyadobacter tibetensis TaxID=1211851 RepID=UPI00046F4939|nr:T9SS type A sorting domain-containing protein [Dyadobacter tibetensis]
MKTIICLSTKITVLLGRVVFIFILLSLPVKAQNTISYTVTEDTHYEVSNKVFLKNVSSQDLIEMRPTREVYKMTKAIDGDYFSETKEYLVTNKNETWYPDTKKIVTDNIGTKIYNSKGDLIFEREHSEELRSQIDKDIKSTGNRLNVFEFPDANTIKLEAKAQNVSFKELPNGHVLLKRALKTNVDGTYLDFGTTQETEIDTKNYIVNRKTNDSKDHELKSEEIYFKKVFKNESKALKVFERHKEEHQGYANIYKTSYVRYEHYELDGKRVFDDKKSGELEDFDLDSQTDRVLRLFPNPTATEITAKYSKDLIPSGITIENNYGLSVLTVILDQDKGAIKLDVSKLAPGLYTVKLTHSTGVIRQQFVKQ